jgi:hypothetical protein
MHNIFDDGFDAKDAAIMGGVIGFVEESMREEDRVFEDEEFEEKLLERVSNRDVNLVSFSRSHPDLFRKIVHTIVAQRAQWAQERRDFEEVKEELIAIEKCEAMLKGDK